MTIDAPLSIGEIFDHAVGMVIEHWRPVLVLQMICGVAVVASRIAAQHSHDARFVVGSGYFPVVISVVTAPAIIASLASSRDDQRLTLALRVGVRTFWRSLVATIMFYVAFAVALGAAFVCFAIFKAFGGWFVYVGWALYAVTATFAVSTIWGYAAIGYANLVLESTMPVRALRDALRRSATTGSRRVLLIGGGIFVLTYLPQMVVLFGPGKLLSDGMRDAAEFLLLMTTYVYGYAVQTVASIDYRNRARGDDLMRVLNPVTI